ncbi:MAG: hypothetical protein IPP90_02290 [Gemmatimonadaceae bacterium]|nr:hypothetical protein [Gemmatimonadaceae bacterium]
MAWRLVDVALQSRTSASPELSPECRYGPGQDLAFMQTDVTANPAEVGFIWALQEPLIDTLVGPQRPTPGLYLSSTPRSNAATVTTYPAGLNGAVPLAHRFNGSFSGERVATGSFTFSIDPFSGQMSGNAMPLICPGKSQLPPVCTRDYAFTVQATKQGNSLTGTIQFDVYGFNRFFLCTSVWRFRGDRLP